MSKFSEIIAATFVKCTGYTYSNMARLFIRLFVGVMFMQFGIRHLVNYEIMADSFPTILGLSSHTCLILMIVVEIVCSLFIMVGFLTRISVIPPIVSMVAAEYHILHDLVPQISVYGLDSVQPGYLPIMFIGIYLYILLAGPGKISLDYFISLFLLSRNGKNESDELEEV
ncbi:MAG: DoxX family protein [Muribaculaceae bacterium]|jgi:putative oxidoreductase|nr:DoxX family protein [Muribaculaceae bacterium]